MADGYEKRRWTFLICLLFGFWWVGGCASGGPLSIPRFSLPFASRQPDPVYIGHQHHYFLIPVPGPDLHEATAIRVTRHFRDILQERQQEVTLAQELGASQEERERNRQIFEQFFFEPDGVAALEVRRMAGRVGANLAVTCRLVEYGEIWRERQKLLRITIQAACDNLHEQDRYGRYNVTVEMPVKDLAYSDVERAAATRILEKIWSRVHPTPTPTPTDTPVMTATPTPTRTETPRPTPTWTALPPTSTPTAPPPAPSDAVPEEPEEETPTLVPFRYDFEGTREEAPVEQTPLSEQ